MIIGIDASRAMRGQRTGTERYSLEIIRHLLGLPAAEQYHWRLYTDQALSPVQRAELTSLAAPSTVTAHNIDIRTLPTRRLWTHRVLAQEVRQHPPDVLFVPAHVIPFIWPRNRLPPSVVTIHDLGYHYFPESHTYSQRLYLRVSTRWSTRAARRVIAVSQATANDLSTFYATPAAKIRVVHEAAIQGKVADQPALEVARRRTDTAAVDVRDGHRPYGLYIGTIQPRKNLARVIEAYARLHERDPLSWDLILAGAPGWLSRSLYAMTAEMGLADRIHLPGYVADSGLPALLHGARFFCFPSLFEGFGLPVLEAQSHGVPVMASNNSSLPEIAGDAALLVDPTDIDAIANAMLQLSQDEALRQRLIAAGYENVKRFSWEKAARETLAVLEEAASGESVKG